MTPPNERQRAAPRVLDPVLALVERVDRWRRRIRPVLPGALLGVERAGYRGPGTVLADGTPLAPGDRVWVLHFDNARLRGLVGGPDRWPTAAYRVAVEDLRALARQVEVSPPDERPAAMGGVTLLASLTRRLGFEVVAREPGPRARLEDWYLRSLLARWAPAGRGRLSRGRGELRASATWISTDELLRRYGPPPE
ncbi:MAG TPA: hypothetical protein VF071_11995 [Candidatus Limnocylindria bacterium]